MRKNFRWIPEDVDKLRTLYPTTSLEDLSLLLGIPERVIRSKVARLGMRKAPEILSEARRNTGRSNIVKMRESETYEEKRRQGISDMIRRERIRMKYGLKRKTQRNVSIRSQADISQNAQRRFKMRRRGYFIDDDNRTLYFTSETKRDERMEQRFKANGYKLIKQQTKYKNR